MVELSGILTTFNRAHLLERVLGSIVMQTLAPERYELVIIDDGSTDDTSSVIKRYSSLLPIRYFYQANSGLAAARNLALAMACAPIVLFMDDDDIIEPETLEAHLSSHYQHPQEEIAILGHTRLADEIANDILMHYVTEICPYLFSYKGVRPSQSLGFDYFWGGRTSCKRDFVLRNGSFNSLFRFGCEDIELGYRLALRGLKVLYNPRAVSVMIRPIGFDGFCERLRRQGSSHFIFSRLFPNHEVQTWCEMPLFHQEWSTLTLSVDQHVKSARDLDQWVRHSQNLALPVDDSVIGLLHTAYSDAFKACKLSGMAKAREAWGRELIADRKNPVAASQPIAKENVASILSNGAHATKLVSSRHESVTALMQASDSIVLRALSSRTQLAKQTYHRFLFGRKVATHRANKLIGRANLNESKALVIKKKLISRTWLVRQLLRSLLKGKQHVRTQVQTTSKEFGRGG